MWFDCAEKISILIEIQKVVTGDLTYQTMNQIEKKKSVFISLIN